MVATEQEGPAESREGSVAEATQPEVVLSHVRVFLTLGCTTTNPLNLLIHARPLAANWSLYSVKMCSCSDRPDLYRAPL